MIRKIGTLEIEVEMGDIADQPLLAAVVNAANPQLTTGGGVAGAIHSKAGPNLYKECMPLAPIAPGEAVITKAYNLPNEYVIHCLGPVYGKDKPEDKFLKNCYINSLALAERHLIASIGFPTISTGIYGYPKHKAAEVVFNVLLDQLPKLKSLKKIKFVVFDEDDKNLYEKNLEKF